MRQFFLYAMMMAGVLASCSQNENEGLPDNEPVDLTPSAEPIMISAASPSVVVNTRSAGSIGADGASDPTNTWSGQDLYIFACQKNSETGETMNDRIPDPTTYPLYNEHGTVASGKTASIVWENNKTLYFPRSNAYDFFGYYADDASTKAPTVMTLNNANVLYVPFTINGSQDLMIAKAALTEQQKTDLGENVNKAYSAFTARKNVQPSMKFEHLLTRLVFKVQGLGDAKPENVYVQSIKVKSKATSKLVIVYTSENEKNKGIQWDAADDGSTLLALQERNAEGKMQALDFGITIPEDLPQEKDPSIILGRYPVSATDTPAKVVGEALLVNPNVDTYTVEIEVVQYYDEKDQLIPDEMDAAGKSKRYYKYTLDLKASDVTKPTTESGKEPENAGITTFAPSTSYNIIVGIYGLEPMEITAELGNWVPGGDINVVPDDM